MLVMSPAAKRQARRLARRKRDALRGRFGRDRFELLVRRLVRLHRLLIEVSEPVCPFGLEGALRASLRADLCLEGWRWSEADQAARELLSEVYRRLRAERPSWAEGQPEWVQHRGTLIERTRCVKCHTKLPEGHSKFCSRLCATTYHDRLSLIRKAGEDQIVALSSRWI